LLALALAGSAAAGGAQWRPTNAIRSDEVRITASPYQPEAQFSSNANEIQVEVRALDRGGHEDADLQETDFAIYDEGQLQPTSAFKRVSRAGPGPVAQPAPASAAATIAGCAPTAEPGVAELFFDDLGGLSNDLAFARGKAMAYLQRASCLGNVRGGERIGVVTASGLADLDATEDPVAIRNAVQRVAFHPRLGEIISCPLISPYQAWELVIGGATSGAGQLAIAQALRCNACQPDQCDTYVHDRAEAVWGLAEAESEEILARLRSTVAALARQPGRRVLVVTSAGFLTQTQDLQRRQQALIDMAIRSGVTINALDSKALQAPEAANGRWDDPWLGNPDLDNWRLSNEAGGFSPVDSALWEIAESTGGDFLHDNNNLEAGYERDVEGPEAFYSLSFVPTALKFDGAFHHIKIKVTRPGDWRVAARYGYFAPSADDAPLTTEQQQLLAKEVTGNDRQGKLDALLGAQAAPGGVHATIRLNPNTLALKHTEGRHVDHLILVFALLTPGGQFITGERADVSLRLADSSLKEISRPGAGLPVGATLTAAPGTYRLRAVALEPSTGALMTITGKLNIAPP